MTEVVMLSLLGCLISLWAYGEITNNGEDNE